MPAPQNEALILQDSFAEPGGLPAGWSRVGDVPEEHEAKALVGVGGSFDSSSQTCLHLIKFAGPCLRLGVTREVNAPSQGLVTIAFRLAAWQRGLGAKAMGQYNGRDPGFRVWLKGPSGARFAGVEVSVSDGSILFNGESTGRDLPMLVGCSFALLADSKAQRLQLCVDGEKVAEGVPAGELANGIAGIEFLLPDDEVGHVALWVTEFGVYEGLDPSVAPAASTDRVPAGAAPLPKSGAIMSLEPGRVKATGRIGRRVDMGIQRNMMALDIEKDFLKPYEKLDREGAEDGEAMEAGIFVGSGKLLDAFVQMAFYSRDEAVSRARECLAEKLIGLQNDNGYIGVYPDRPDRCPLFTEFCLHDAVFLVLGLAKDYRLFGREASLDAAKQLADYILKNWAKRPRRPIFTSLGINEAFLELHGCCGDRRLLDFIARTRSGKAFTVQEASLLDWDQELWKGGHPDRYRKQGGQAAERHAIIHAYRLYERGMAQLKLHEHEPDERLTVMPRKLIDRLRDPERTGMLITGATGHNEGWEDTQLCTGNTGETCTTVYGIWFMEALLKHTGDLAYGDFMERMIYNSLFCAQEPEGRRLRYFSPPSGKREYYHRDTYCCPNNFRRGIIRLPEHIYYRHGNGIAVNLFEASEAEIDVNSDVTVRLRQVTEYPAGEISSLIFGEVKGQGEFSVSLRIPSWCEDASVTVNGEPTEPVTTRPWKTGDRIEVHLPMPWRFVRGRCGQAGRIAVMRGPLVYCLSRELNNLPEDMVLRDITLDSASVETAERDDRGVLDKPVCRIRAWSPGRDLGSEPDLTLKLHEFPEPSGEEVYFRTPDATAAVDDELFSGGD